MTKFIGNKGGVHIHIEGNPIHFKYGKDTKSRYDFDMNKTKEVEAAFTEFLKTKEKSPWKEDAKGWNACLTWFKDFLGVRRRIDKLTE